MFWSVNKQLGFELLYEQLYLVPAYENLMKLKGYDGRKLMRLLIMMYDIFSEYNMDYRDEEERFKIICHKLGMDANEKVLQKSEFVEAKEEFLKTNFDSEVEQIKNVEFSIARMIEERDTLMKLKSLEKKELEKVDMISSTLKKLFAEREELTTHFIERCKAGGIGKGRLVGNKKLSYLANSNNAERLNGAVKR